MNWSLVYCFFRTLSLAHLERSIFSLSKQYVLPDDLVFFDNNTEFSEDEIKAVVAQHFDLSRWRFYFEKHGDPRKTSASWCQNHAIQLAKHNVFILARADIIYDFSCLAVLTGVFASISNPMCMVSCHVKHMDFWNESYTFDAADHAADLEPLNWREDVQRLVVTRGRHFTETHVDAVSFCTSKTAMAAADWYDEDLTSWGLWQQSLQMDMGAKGVGFVVVPEMLMFHMQHGADRNTDRSMHEFNTSRRRQGIRNTFIP